MWSLVSFEGGLTSVTDIAGREGQMLVTLAKEINSEHRAFVGSLSRTVEHGIRAGELLAEAKSKCQHGEWSAWLGVNFEASQRTAQVYMQMFKGRDEIRAKTQGSADLSISGALKEISSPGEAPGDQEGGESPTMSREDLDKAMERANEALAKIKEHEREYREAEEQGHKGIDGLIETGHIKEARVQVREKAFFKLGLAIGAHNMNVVSARYDLKDYLDVLAAGGSSGAGAIRERVEERRLEPLSPEERDLLKRVYPEQLASIDARDKPVRFFLLTLQILDDLVCPADMPEVLWTDGLKAKKLTVEQTKTPIAMLLRTGVVEEADVYRFERWPHPLLWIGWPSEEEDDPKDWRPSEWWVSKKSVLLTEEKEEQHEENLDTTTGAGH